MGGDGDQAVEAEVLDGAGALARKELLSIASVSDSAAGADSMSKKPRAEAMSEVEIERFAGIEHDGFVNRFIVRGGGGDGDLLAGGQAGDFFGVVKFPVAPGPANLQMERPGRGADPEQEHLRNGSSCPKSKSLVTFGGRLNWLVFET